MDASFIPIETVPSKTPFGLDQLRRSYKTALSAEDAMAAAPNEGDPDESFPNMFLMPITTPESAESATRIDLVYMGSLQGEEGSPVLPAQKHDEDDAVGSASSSKSSAGTTVESPTTVQFYGPSKILTWFTFEAPGVKGTVEDPDRDIEVITVTVGDTTFSYGSVGIQGIVDLFFSRQISDTIQSEEVVPGKYWQNVERKTLGLVPFVNDFTPGFYPYPYSGGSGYDVGDSITITGTGSCTMDVVTVYTPMGQISATTITSNTLSAATSIPITATGGSGSGAKYTVIEVT